MKVSELQQDIVCDSDQSVQFKKLKQLFKTPDIRPDDLLRTSILFCLRYEKKLGSDKKEILRLLDDAGVSEDEIELLNYVLEYAGEMGHTPDLFNKGMFTSMISGLTKEIKGVGNVYTQHRPLILEYLEQLKTGKLRDTTFPIIKGASLKGEVQNVMIYIVGGVTYEEAYYVAQFNKNNPSINVTIGGSCMINSVGFLSSVKNLSIASH